MHWPYKGNAHYCSFYYHFIMLFLRATQNSTPPLLLRIMQHYYIILNNEGCKKRTANYSNCKRKTIWKRYQSYCNTTCYTHQLSSEILQSKTFLFQLIEDLNIGVYWYFQYRSAISGLFGYGVQHHYQQISKGHTEFTIPLLWLIR